MVYVKLFDFKLTIIGLNKSKNYLSRQFDLIRAKQID
jgi:hypothetical protein